MRALLIRLLVGLSRSSVVQRLLEHNVNVSQYLMGIGSGGGVGSSGETVLVQLLRQLHTKTGHPLCVFDVGANKGQFLRLMIEGLQSLPLELHAFEPGRHTFEILNHSFEGRVGVTLNNVALGSESGQLELYYDEAGSGLASLTRRQLDHVGVVFNRSETVSIQTLDAYCADRGIEAIDLLKLDVEGHELDVLTGGSRMLGERRIRMVSFEFGGCNIDSRTYLRDFWNRFREHGMHCIYRITPSGSLVPITQYREVYEQFRTTNFLARLSEV